MSHYLPLPPPYMPHCEPLPVTSKPLNQELTKDVSPTRSLPSPTTRSDSPFTYKPLRGMRRASIANASILTKPVTSNSHPSARSSPHYSQQNAQTAHQLAAEALLTMAPGPTKPASSTSKPAASVPAPTASAASSTAPTRSTPNMSEDLRGIKRKSEDDPVSRPASSLNSGDKLKERSFSRSPLNEQRQDLLAPMRSPLTRQQPGATAAGTGSAPGSAASTPSQNTSVASGRQTLLGSVGTRDPLSVGHSPWASLTRYNPLGVRRETPSPASASAARPGSSVLASANRTATDPLHRDSRLFPSASSTSLLGNGLTTNAGYGLSTVGRRELVEHRESLKEGKKWLDQMLSKTEKLLNLVETRLTASNTDTAASVGTSLKAHANDDWEYEEKDRRRQQEILRLEEEMRVDREKREREKADREKAEKERLDRERSHSTGLSGLHSVGGFFGRERTLPSFASSAVAAREAREAREARDAREREALARERERERERHEADRNRDLLLASRRVTAISPNARERSTPGGAGSNLSNQLTTGQTSTSTGLGGSISRPASSASGAEANRTISTGAHAGANAAKTGAGTSTGTTSTAAQGTSSLNAHARKTASAWDGDPVMSGIPLPRREQGLRGMGRGLWSFDVRG